MATPNPPLGSIVWLDLAVGDAPAVRDFYRAVVGWGSSDVDMGGYPDFLMTRPESPDGVAGVCHARGPNANLPPQWLAYIVVGDVEESMAACRKHGGKVIAGPSNAGGGSRSCVIQDPAGAVLALVSYPPISQAPTISS